ncbi:hypothetical protein ACFL1X_06445 [Candidatus Hydrogenedentota bacterium]
MEIDRMSEDGAAHRIQSTEKKRSRGTSESVFWRLATGSIWIVIFVLGFFSSESYNFIRTVALVNPIKALSNSQFFWAGAIAVLVGFFVSRRCCAACGDRALSRDMGIVYTFLAMVAFFPLPMFVLYAVFFASIHPLLIALKDTPGILLIGFAFKGAAFVYLSWRFAVCIVFGDDTTFSMGMMKTEKAGKPKDKAEKDAQVEDNIETDRQPG